ncbi:MAG TPA: GtrA family protein [Gammaproteobacteria bacterium]|nr:GtrA family protein [Gammaproteobacteria bacterium]
MFDTNMKDIPRFFVAGVLSTATHYAVLFGLYNDLNIELVLASSFGALAGAIVNYFINYFYTFNSHRRHVYAVGSFILVVSSGMLLNALVVGLTFHLLGMPALLAQLCASLIAFSWNYQAHQRWTF